MYRCYIIEYYGYNINMYNFYNTINKENLKLKQGFKYGIIPTLIQFGILFVAMLIFKYLIDENSTMLIQDKIQIAGKETDPNIIRFIYMFIAFICAYVLGFIAHNKSKDTTLAFWLGLVGGVLLWQAIGECSWHFYYQVDETIFTLPQIEGPSGTALMIMIIPIIVYFIRNKTLSFGFGIFLLSFMINWEGHFILEGTYPYVSSLLNEKTWFIIFGLLIGICTTLFALYLMFYASTNKEGYLVSSIILYVGLGIILTGVIGI